MDRDEAHALRQMIRDQAERLSDVREQASKARRALLDHDLELVRYWLNQIEETATVYCPSARLPRQRQRVMRAP